MGYFEFFGQKLTNIFLAICALPSGQAFAFVSAQLEGNTLGSILAGLITLARISYLGTVRPSEAGPSSAECYF
jgi:hypothetical protein